MAKAQDYVPVLVPDEDRFENRMPDLIRAGHSWGSIGVLLETGDARETSLLAHRFGFSMLYKSSQEVRDDRELLYGALDIPGPTEPQRRGYEDPLAEVALPLSSYEREAIERAQNGDSLDSIEEALPYADNRGLLTRFYDRAIEVHAERITASQARREQRKLRGQVRRLIGKDRGSIVADVDPIVGSLRDPLPSYAPNLVRLMLLGYSDEEMVACLKDASQASDVRRMMRGSGVRSLYDRLGPRRDARNHFREKIDEHRADVYALATFFTVDPVTVYTDLRRYGLKDYADEIHGRAIRKPRSSASTTSTPRSPRRSRSRSQTVTKDSDQVRQIRDLLDGGPPRVVAHADAIIAGLPKKLPPYSVGLIRMIMGGKTQKQILAETDGLSTLGGVSLRMGRLGVRDLYWEMRGKERFPL